MNVKVPLTMSWTKPWPVVLIWWHKCFSDFRWVRPDIAERSGSVVIEVDIPTGFYVRKQTLRSMVVKGLRVPVKRFRFYRQKVLLYIDFVSVTSHVLMSWRELDDEHPLACATFSHSQVTVFTLELALFQVDTQGACYPFFGDRWYPVANTTIQHAIRIMDTSEPGQYTTCILHSKEKFWSNNHAGTKLNANVNVLHYVLYLSPSCDVLWQLHIVCSW